MRKLGNELRKWIRISGLTRNQIAVRAGMSYAIVHAFVAGGDIRLSSADRIAVVVEKELRRVRRWVDREIRRLERG